MKISVENFKGIRELREFPIRSITVLAGSNSGGKSSLIQLLLLLKQSLEARSTTSPLKLNRPYVSLGRFENIVRRATGVNSFSATIHLDREDLDQRLVDLITGKRKSPGMRPTRFLEDVSEVSVKVRFKRTTSGIAIDLFRVDLQGTDDSVFFSIERHGHGKSHALTTNAASYFLRQYRYTESQSNSQHHLPEEGTFKDRVGFLGFIPNELDFDHEDLYLSFSPLMSQIGAALHSAFSKISYIGPLREEPREFYYHDDDFVDHIGNKGENGAFLLSKHAKDRTEYKQYERTGDGYSVTTKQGSLEEAVNYWMCNIFGLAKAIKVSKAKTNRHLYEVYLRRNDGTHIPITHVGFGISQIFPVLIEGLRASDQNRLIILEQPEIHLHPRVQSWLFDFVHSASDHATFLIETHSDHFINRLRLRVAEDTTNDLHSLINLTFVNPGVDGVDYDVLELSETGALDHWPVGFFDQYEDDLKRLVIAQAKKRKARAASGG